MVLDNNSANINIFKNWRNSLTLKVFFNYSASSFWVDLLAVKQHQTRKHNTQSSCSSQSYHLHIYVSLSLLILYGFLLFCVQDESFVISITLPALKCRNVRNK